MCYCTFANLLSSRGLNIIKEDAREEDVRVAFLLQNFFQYVEDKWINDVNRRRWMAFYNSMFRTNNLCESHNRMLRNAVGAYRPNIYAFINALARLEHNADLDVDLMKRGAQQNAAANGSPSMQIDS